MKPRAAIPKLSAKKRAALKGRPVYSTISSPKKAIRKVNPKRRAKAFERTYLSKERVIFVKAMACAACGTAGFAVNAHLLGNDGARRKGHYTTVGPLCGSDPWGPDCHFLYDNDRSEFNARFPDFDPEKVAAETEARWQVFLQQPHRID